VEENSPTGTLVTDEILAQDPDSLADLEFSIDWPKTYATNKGVRVEDATIYAEYLTKYIQFQISKTNTRV
jgi:hypothetical protein